MMEDELKQIKKLYGEEMMHLCRDLFPSILENKGLLLSLLQSTFASTHSLANDIKENDLYEEFKSLIYSFIDVEENNKVITNKTPFELMNEAGYKLYECKSELDIQRFKKYYSPDEVLCTINNGGRLNRCHVFFAVKHNVDEIKRENFPNPKRQDEYGTSVISIQFSKDHHNTLSIKNRYNHTVNNPDSTFSNNLENIIPGLTDSFEKYYGYNINQNARSSSAFLTEELDYIKGSDGKFYRYNSEINGAYYCENNIIIKDGNVITKYRDNPERYILIDDYILDLANKNITKYDDNGKEDSFIKSINDVGNIKKIEVNKNDKNRTVTIEYDNNRQVTIELNKQNEMIEYENKHITEIGDSFLFDNKSLCEISLPNVRKIGNEFMFKNENINYISLPNVQTIGNDFMYGNEKLKELSLPNVKTVGYDFMFINEKLEKLSLPNVQKIGNDFMFYNYGIEDLTLPNVQKIGARFMYNSEIKKLSLPNVHTIEGEFMSCNDKLTNIYIPNVKLIGRLFLKGNTVLDNISLPNVERIQIGFLMKNKLINKDHIFQEMEKKYEETSNQRNK